MDRLKYVLVLQILITTFTVENVIAKTLISHTKDKTEGVIAEVKGLKKDIEDIRKDDEELKKSYPAMPHNTIALNGEVRSLDREDTGPNDVFFTVDLRNDIKGISVGDTVKYTAIVSNGGNGYDMTTGIFTAPTSGVYHFEFFCNSQKAGTTTLAMMLNGSVEATCFVEPAFDGEDEAGGDVLVVRLDIGDRMWVKVTYAEASTTDLKAYANTFAGVLVHR